MKVVCALSADDDLPCRDFDVLVLPEGLPQEHLLQASQRFPSAIVVGAASDGSYMRAYLLINGFNTIDYLKIGNDGRSRGTGRRPKSNMYQTDRFAVGVLVCMDVDDHRYRQELKDRLLHSSAATKLLCVPGDMQGHWFSTEPILGWTGINLAISNNNVTYLDDRAHSGVAGPDGRWLARQSMHESICATVA